MDVTKIPTNAGGLINGEKLANGGTAWRGVMAATEDPRTAHIKKKEMSSTRSNQVMLLYIVARGEKSVKLVDRDLYGNNF